MAGKVSDGGCLRQNIVSPIKNKSLFLFQIINVIIPVEDRELDGIINVPKSSSWAGYAVVLTHGAGADMHYTHLDKLASCLADTGILCLRFTCKTPNFQYRARCFASAVVSAVRCVFIQTKLPGLILIRYTVT